MHDAFDIFNFFKIEQKVPELFDLLLVFRALKIAGKVHKDLAVIPSESLGNIDVGFIARVIAGKENVVVDVWREVDEGE